jgi:photosystem II stability/assembly factor-like uncharacterized protein
MKSVKPVLFFLASFFFLFLFLYASAGADPLDNWTPRHSGTSNSLNGITFGNGRFVVVGDNGTILSSSNGFTWTARNSGTTVRLRDVTHGGNYFIAVGAESTILTSPDGVSWQKIASGFGHPLSGVTFGGQFVAMVENDKVVYSIDGARWVFRYIGDYGFRHDATYGAGTYIAVGNNGTIITTNASACCSWASRSSATTENLRGVAYGAASSGKFVAVGSNGTIVTSPDGVIFTKRDSGTTVSLSSVAYGSNTFVAVGANGTILSSAQGLSWTSRSSGNNVYLTNVTYGNGTFVAIGVSGHIFQSGVNSGGSGLPTPPGSLTIE